MPVVDPIDLAVQQACARRERRHVLRGVAGLFAGAMLGSLASGTEALAEVPEADRRLALINAHTWERLDVVYFSQGRYDEDALTRINELMRDHRADKARIMDRGLIDDLVRLHATLDTEEPIHLLSGYRTPETNARLRKRSMGVAKYSLHMEGRAADIHVPGIGTRALQQAALAMQSGGVGYYRRSGFVHLDTGRIRHWERG